MENFFLIALAVFPVLVIMLYVYFRDKYDKEPFIILLVSFLLGVFSIIPAIILESLWELTGISIYNNIFETIIYAFIVVGLSEEYSKYFFLRYYSFRRKAFNEQFDGIVYAVMISMGFAMTENILYVMEHGAQVGFLRAVTAVPAHACFAVFMGYFVGKAKFESTRKRRRWYLFVGLYAATFFHGFYDFFLFQNSIEGLAILSLIGLLIAIIISFRAIKKHLRNSRFKPQ